MIDKRALYPISAGVYLLTTIDGSRGVGRVVDAVSQVSSDPKRVSVSLLKSGHTWKVVGATRHFCLTTLADDAPLQLIQDFGYQSSANVDKFLGHQAHSDERDVPWTPEGALSRLSCDVIATLDMGSHLLVIGEVTEAEVLAEGSPMTYAGYRELKAGTVAGPGTAQAIDAPGTEPPAVEDPPAAAGGSGTGGRIGWRCIICGYVVEADELPQDFTCPVCGVGREMFERIEIAG